MHGKLKPWVVAMGLALFAQIAPAAGFGKINVNSSLGQPLSAEIDLLNVSQEDLVGMTVRMATADAFRDANVDYSAALSTVRFMIEKHPNGQPFIRVTSSAPISEPAINLLVEVNWPSGRLLRDYPVLLNPAGYGQDHAVADSSARMPIAPPEVQVRQPAPVAAAAATGTAPAAAAGGAMAQAAKPAQQAQHVASAQRVGKPGESYVIQPGDTLRALASGNRPGSASLEQTMLAMFEANRSVFIHDSIHRIRAGAKLHLPTSEEATNLSAEEASKRLSLLASDFDAYRRRVAENASASPSAVSGGKGPVAGRLTAATEDLPAAKPAGSDVLQISRSAGSAAKPANAAKAPTDKAGSEDAANRIAEEKIAHDNALREANDRVALLEGNLKQMRKLLSEKGAADAKPAADAGAEKTAPAPTPAAVVTPPVSAPELLKPVAPPLEVPKPAAENKPDAAAAGHKMDAEPSFTEELVDAVSDNPLALLVGGLSTVAASWLGLGFLRRRRQRTEELFAPSTTSPEPMTVDAVTSDKASALVDTAQSGYVSEYERTVPEHQVEEVDPVAEADVYIAYGRDVQAEEILKEAMAKDPDRTEILMKLLEIYAQRKSREEYASHAVQLRDRVGEEHPLWSAAMAMGYEIDPENPLYGGAGHDFVPSLAPPPAPDLDLDLGDAFPHESSAHSALPDLADEAQKHAADDVTVAWPKREVPAEAIIPPLAAEHGGALTHASEPGPDEEAAAHQLQSCPKQS